MLPYRRLALEIEKKLAGRRLIFFGTRGADAYPLLELRNFDEIFSQVAPLDAIAIKETCLETMKGQRVDLNAYSIDRDHSEAVSEMRAELLRSFGRPTAVMAYRPSELLASACFARANLVNYLGVFHEQQSCFEHKPWVETQLASRGVRVVPWSYFADDDIGLIRELAENGPIVLRTNRSDGGAGLALIRDPGDVQKAWPSHQDGFLAAAPFLEPSLPLNINACLFDNGEISIHPASLQLIGLPTCTSRRFGYCGNDFSQIANLLPDEIEAFEGLTRNVGRWLHRHGYLGAFGIDALLFRGKVYLVEINPRFQGSSSLAARLMRDLDLPDLYLDHLAAFLGLKPALLTSLKQLVGEVPKLAHLVIHNTTGVPVFVDAQEDDRLNSNLRLLPAKNVSVEPEAIVVNLVLHSEITPDGTTLTAKATAVLQEVVENLVPSCKAVESYS